MSIVATPRGLRSRLHGSRSSDKFFVLKKKLSNYFNIIYALMMHDIKNRFFGSGLGQVVMVLWPFVHILVLLTIYLMTNRQNPYGSSIIQYSAVSVFPFICFSYVSRWIVFSAMTNKAFLQYPIIRPLDLLVARTVLEVVSISIVGVLLIVLVICSGGDAMPQDHAQAVYAACAAIFLSIGVGFPNAVIAFIAPMWNIVIALAIICAYVSSGILFVVAQLPEQMRVPLSYNPVLQCVEWMRTAYYLDYPTSVLDRAYVLEFGLVSLTFGLILMRILRRFI